MPSVPWEGRSVCRDLGAAAGLCIEFGPEWQGQLLTKGHWRAKLGRFGQVLLSSTRVQLLLVFLPGLVRDVKT